MAKTATAIAAGNKSFLQWLDAHAKGGLFLAAIISFFGSIFSMAVIYGDPLAHVKICLGGQVEPMVGSNALVLYGHCGWCYLALGLALAALVAPAKAK